MTGTVKKVLKSLSDDQCGYVLFLALFVILIVSLVGVALIVVGTSEVNLSARSEMMERAYSIAEAGVDRAVSEVGNDVDLAGSRTGTIDVADASLLWKRSEVFPGDNHGKYDVSLYYDTSNPTETGGTGGPWTGDPFYKRIMSTGTYTWGGKSVERTIEVKAYVPSIEQGSYDEALDFCIYNGFNSMSDESGRWPSNDSNEFESFSAGQFTFDGSTPYEGHAPKGALYTRGDLLLMMTGLIGTPEKHNTVTVKGNVVATGDITIANTVSKYSDMIVGDNIGDKVVAGLDGTGKASVAAVGTIGGVPARTQTIDIKATLCAAGDVDIVGEYELESFEIGDIISGGNVALSRFMNTGLVVGNVLCTGKAGIESMQAFPIVINSIWAGEYEGDTSVWDMPGLSFRNVGVALASAVCTSVQVTGISPYYYEYTEDLYGEGNGEEYSIISSGELLGILGIGELVVGDVKVGYGHNLASYAQAPLPEDDTNKRVGIYMTCAIGSCQVGDILSTGRLDMKASYVTSGITTGSITAGSDAYEGMPPGTVPVGVGWLGIADYSTYARFTSGPVIAVGDVNMVAAGFKGISIGYVISGGNIDLESPELSNRACGINTGTLAAAGDVSLKSRRGVSIDSGSGTIYARGNVSFECETGILATTAVSGIWGQGVTVNRNSGVDDGLKIGPIPFITDSIRATGDVSLTAASGETISLSKVRLPTSRTYTKSGTITGGARVNDDTLTLPTVPAVSTPPKPAIPQVDMEEEAGLSGPVRLPEPNWWYFMQAAIEDDKACGYSSTTPHMVYEDGPGDYHSDPGIQFEWHSNTYSSNETVYNGNPGVTLYIELLNWQGQGHDPESPFIGTIVSKGPVVVTATGGAWVLEEKQELNIISGSDITFSTEGGSGVPMVANCHFHFFASNNIVFEISLGVQREGIFYGSFTAGNKVDIDTAALFENCTFRWSRWSIDPAGWLPAFKLLSWREV